MTIGISPTFASTGYGYIRSTAVEGKAYRKVEEFVEKPDEETAREYLEAGSYAWNSGMFIWKASTILSYYKKQMCIRDRIYTQSPARIKCFFPR